MPGVRPLTGRDGIILFFLGLDQTFFGTRFSEEEKSGD